tara:strand:+ start:2154 stop:3449 length:1296 start_codon:yes stop_codon:yes gene_type:complete
MSINNLPLLSVRQQLLDFYGWEFDSLTDRMLQTGIEMVAVEQGLTHSLVIEQLGYEPLIREKLLDCLVIPETSFFRYPESFSYLKSIAKEYLKKNNHKKIRIASIPCATGEEPYSIAMSLLEAGIPSDQFEIDALDISLPLIQKAKQGIYLPHKLTQHQDVIESNYFNKHPLGIQVKPVLRQQINFIHGNIIDMPKAFFEKKYDVIFCRNLLIYLSKNHRHDFFQQLKKIIQTNGQLFVGPVEVSFFNQQGLISLNKPKTYALSLTNNKNNQAVKKSTKFQINNKSLATQTNVSKIPFKKSPVINNRIANINVYSANKPFAKTLPKPLSKVIPPSLQTARNFADTGQFLQALELTNSLFDKSKDEELYLLHGEILLALKKFPEAVLTFKKALYLNSKNKQALQHLALLSQRLGDNDNARRYFNRLNSNQEA